MDIEFSFIILNVPDEETSFRIAQALERVLEDEFSTQITIIPEEI